jgi:hypothetical protein
MGSGFRVQGLGLRVGQPSCLDDHLLSEIGLRVEGLGVGV